MSKNLYINQTFNECRAVLVENGEILDFLIDRGKNKFGPPPSVGNIYKGKVLKIFPGIQSAFVNIGYHKAAFLYVDEAYLPSRENQKEKATDPSQEKHRRDIDGKSLGKVIDDELSTLSETIHMRFRPKSPIESFLKEGDEILVQISKEPISTKGPRVTRQITLAGRHIVFMPFIEHIGVSRRIFEPREHERLKQILEEICPQGQGLIARTVAEERDLRTLKTDLEMLLKIWKDLQNKFRMAKAPHLCYQDLNFIQRILRDITSEDVDTIYVDDQNNQKEVERFTKKFLPKLRDKCHFYEGDIPLFEKFGIDMEIERGLANKVYLRSGGSLNIDQTEALVSIDVNTGKFMGRKNVDETILRTNLEAVREIAYQIRLRNCGGIIIIDFIDMEKQEHREQVYQTLVEALQKDSSKIRIMPISGLGLIEMTRKRTRDTLTRIISDPCPYCEGSGKIKSTISVCYELVRELVKTLKKSIEHKPVHIYAHPEVITYLCDDELSIIDSLEETYGRPLVVRAENSYHIEQYEIFL